MQIMTGDGILCIPRVQPAGKNPMPAKNFLNGIQLAIGDTLAGDDSA
jgi:methionyl-tRNA formyltransferase